MKLFLTSQISNIDKYTIEHEPISSVDLMERAANEIFKKIVELFSTNKKFIIVAGNGNNGGDGLVVARLLFNAGYSVRVFILNVSGKFSNDCQTNIERFKSLSNIDFSIIKNADSISFKNGCCSGTRHGGLNPPSHSCKVEANYKEIAGQSRNDEQNSSLTYIQTVNKNDEIIIDAIFGSGLTRKVEGFVSEIINKINDSGCKIISIDIPSGLFGENNSENNFQNIIKANYTLTLQFPKISFFFAENNKFVGTWHVLPIGLNKDIINSELTNYFYVDNDFIKNIIHKRDKFSHKGIYGHALLIAGSKGKMGAAILSSLACLRTGVGLLTTHVPKCGYEIIQTAVPEVMASVDENENFVTNNNDLKKYDAIGIGPGIGTENATKDLLKQIFVSCNKPIVIDADGLNIISQYAEFLNLLPKNSILTPHPKEFDRLAGNSDNSYHRHLKAKQFAQKYNVYIVLKGANSQIICPDGDCYFNSTGNPGMATAGSGDVLTGIILSLLAQGYSSLHASLLGVYIHGLSGDIVAEEKSQESLIASDLVENLGKAFKKLTFCL